MVVDFTTTQLEQIGPDRVRVSGIGGRPKTSTLKASIAVAEGFVGEDMFFYAGPGVRPSGGIGTGGSFAPL